MEFNSKTLTIHTELEHDLFNRCITFRRVPWEKQTPNLIKLAISINPNNIAYVAPQFLENSNFYLNLMYFNSEVMINVPDNFRTEEFCCEAIKINVRTFSFLSDAQKTLRVCVFVIRQTKFFFGRYSSKN